MKVIICNRQIFGLYKTLFIVVSLFYVVIKGVPFTRSTVSVISGELTLRKLIVFMNTNNRVG